MPKEVAMIQKGQFNKRFQMELRGFIFPGDVVARFARE